MITIATTQYTVSPLSWTNYVAKLSQLVAEAKEKKAQLLLLPEYAGIEFGAGNTDRELYLSLQSFLPDYFILFSNLAKQYNMFIQPGTILIQEGDIFYNRAYFFGPSGKYAYQDKLQLTQYEKNSGVIAQGNKQTIFETPFGKIGIAICYDSEFPNLVQNLVRAGAWLILIPSYTNSIAGYHRVSISSRARALENQCYTMTSFMINEIPFGDQPHDQASGKAGIYLPMDEKLSESGIVIEGNTNQPELITASIDKKFIIDVREKGCVLNYSDSINSHLFPIGITNL